MNENIIKGVLTIDGGKSFLKGDDGVRRLEDELIWRGYLEHWTGRKLCAKRLEQCDYDEGRPIVLMWPDITLPEYQYMELYYNERLRKYPFSVLGHTAVNINGEIFNFSLRQNENEVMSPAEYFYRPALGEFSPHPETGAFNADDRERPYYDKFGRLFMRNIHVFRVRGLDTATFLAFCRRELEDIQNTPVNPRDPERSGATTLFKRNCATIIRDGLRECGFGQISGTFPKDLFISAASCFLKAGKKGDIKVRMLRLKQLKVDEALYSGQTPPVNPLNLIRMTKLPEEYYTDRRGYWAEGYREDDTNN